MSFRSSSSRSTPLRWGSLRSALLRSAITSLALAGLFTMGCIGEVTRLDRGGSGTNDEDIAGAEESSLEGMGGASPLESSDPAAYIYAGSESVPLTYGGARKAGALGQGDLTVIMLVDRSGSMATPWDGSTKWEITKAALTQAIVGVETAVTVGAIFFPSTESCSVLPLHDPQQLQLQRGDLFQARLGTLGEATGAGTPMVEAFLRADEAIHQAIADGALDGRLRLVLLTDGEPNCSFDTDLLVTLADSWRAIGVEVFVMGLPGTESARQLLDRIAGKEVVAGAPELPQDTTWEPGDQGGGAAIAPSSGSDVDDSLELAVR